MHQALLAWINRCNTLDLSEFTPFKVDNITVGAIHRSNLHWLAEHPHVFQLSATDIRLNPALSSPQARTQAVLEITQDWFQRGILTTWRDEPYRVAASFDSPQLMTIERTATSFFGIQRYGMHLNALVEKPDGLYMWISQRAASNPTYPNLFDQMVAGGVSAKHSVRETLLKECEEEAAIPEALAQKAKATGMVSYAMTSGSCLVRDVLFVYDLVLPASFKPHAADGEVGSFHLWPLDKVAQIVCTTQDFKPNTNLVIADFLVRRGVLSAETPKYLEICQGLRQVWKG
jgi:isopentenyldiphosphate isomerase